jgi:hypothetical protein
MIHQFIAEALNVIPQGKKVPKKARAWTIDSPRHSIFQTSILLLKLPKNCIPIQANKIWPVDYVNSHIKLVNR